jgi:hypothetical protein
MINVDELTIGQVKQIAALLPAQQAAEQTIDHGLQIVVLDRGFVYIGYVKTYAGWVHIANAWNIRKWGTTEGLGQLVNGPLADTRLDRVGNVRLPQHALIHLIAVNGEKWTNKLD